MLALRHLNVLIIPLITLGLHACGGDPGANPEPIDIVACGPVQPNPPECTALAAPEPVDIDQDRFALSLFHYNIEYVIGGLEVEDENGEMQTFFDNPDAAGWDNDRVEDWIITESLVPILEMYERHPSWGVSIELQAYMVEVMAERHPESLELLRTLARRGQVELISFHYAAQLFLAYPKEDLERSIERVKATFEQHCLPLSGVVFNQEGQSGEGRQRMLVEQGYTIGVHPKNLWSYVQQGVTPWPYYASEGGTLIVGPGAVQPSSGVEVAWDFFDDGELRAVAAGLAPYFAFEVEADPARVAEFEAALESREASGFKLSTITDYVAHLEAKGVTKPEAPPLVDGTWQPPSTDSIHRWLGGRSEVHTPDEEDNRVRARNAEVRMQVAATQVLVDAAREQCLSSSRIESRMASLWKRTFHSQVSDCSGVNPWLGEVLFCVRENETIMAESAALVADLRTALTLGSAALVVDLKERTFGPFSPSDAPAFATEDTPPDLGMTIRADRRVVTHETTALGPDHWRVSIQIGAVTGDACDGCDARLIDVRFNTMDDILRYSPGLIEDEVRTYELARFNFNAGEAYLPLANGLIGLGNDWWVIKHVRYQHIAARVTPTERTVAFIDETPQPSTAPEWRFELIRGTADEALEVANRLNIYPEVVLP